MNPGERLADRYTLEDKIGGGGMGELWRGSQDALRRAVAIKLIHPGAEMATDEMRERFRREAELAAKVEHRNVVDIIDYGTTDDGTQFLVMPLLKGRSLHERLRAQPGPTLAELTGWIRGVLSGLAAIHGGGIIHRDLKPANVFLARDADGVVPKLLDFGISRSASGDAGLTQMGTAMGTPQFMAPEQFESARDVDLRADIFGVGAVLYRAITGRTPYDGVDAFAVFRATLETRPTSMRALRPDVPAALADVVHRAIAKSAADRYASAREMRDALRAVDEATLGTLRTAGSGADLGTAPTTPAEAAVAGTALMGSSGAIAGTEQMASADGARSPANEARADVPRTARLPTVPGEGEARPPAPGRSAWLLGGLGLFVAAAAGGLAWVGSQAPTPSETLTPPVDPAAAATEPAPLSPVEGPSGLSLSEPSSLSELALSWGRIAPVERPAQVRFVPSGARWLAVTPSDLEQAEAERVAALFGGVPAAADWDPGVGLTPRLCLSRVRLNVHTEPSVESPTHRVLPHDTMVVALEGEHVGARSELVEDGDALAFFVVSRDHTGWALSRYLSPTTACLPLPAVLVRDSTLDERAVRRDMSVARTHATFAGRRAPLWLMVARDRASLRSAIGFYEVGTACEPGPRLGVHTVDGLIDEIFLTETRPGGDSLLLASLAATDPPPADGVLEWSARAVGDDAPVWTELLPTAPYLERGRRGAVSGRRDRILRDDLVHAMTIRRPHAGRSFYTWDGESLVPDADEASEPTLDEPSHEPTLDEPTQNER